MFGIVPWLSTKSMLIISRCCCGNKGSTVQSTHRISQSTGIFNYFTIYTADNCLRFLADDSKRWWQCMLSRSSFIRLANDYAGRTMPAVAMKIWSTMMLFRRSYHMRGNKRVHITVPQRCQNMPQVLKISDFVNKMQLWKGLVRKSHISKFARLTWSYLMT